MAKTKAPIRPSSPSKAESEAGSHERWVLFLWRLPTGSSTPRVTVYRLLRRLGAATLTPGASLLPWREDLVEQLDWLAQDVDEQGGDAWVLQVTDLSQADRRRAVDEVNRERQTEYLEIKADGEAFLARASEHPRPDSDYDRRRRTERELLALQRRFRKVRDRDHFGAQGRAATAAIIDRCLRYRQGISSKLTARTDSHHDV